MDTIEITFQLASWTAAFHKKIDLATKSLSARNEDGRLKKNHAGYRYRMCRSIAGRAMYFSWEPLHPDVPELLLGFHASHFSNIDELHSWLKCFTGEYFSRVLDGKIRRIDCCVDIQVPFDTINECLTQSRAERIEKRRNRQSRKTLYLGKPPRETACYQKMLLREQVDLLNCEQDFEANKPIEVTRVETRLLGKHRPIETFRDVPKLLDFNPFQHLELQAVDEVLLRNANPKSLNLIDAYRYNRDKLGGQEARERFNRNRNFSKAIGKYLGRLDLDLGQVWQYRMKRYLNNSNSYKLPLPYYRRSRIDRSLTRHVIACNLN